MEQTTLVLARPTESMPETRYEKGEMRYMKIQKPGRAVGDARTLWDIISGVLGGRRNVCIRTRRR